MSASYYESLSDSELASQTAELEERIAQIKARGLKLNMARGKPSSEQLDLSRPMLDVLKSDAVLADGGVDCANYGCLEGIPSCRKFFGDILGVPAENVLIGGESSLTLMYDAVSHAMVKGVCGADPMLLQMQARKLKWICLVPGYDRHFGIVSQFGFECVCVPLGEDGPDMDAVEAAVRDPAVKGIWCVPKYSNPQGIVYSDAVVDRLAALRPAAPDFALMWDNAYCLHEVYGEFVPFRDMLTLCREAGNADMVYEFASTSKITFPGAGVAVMAASEANLKYLSGLLGAQTISYDKVNQLRHVRFLQDKAHVLELMQRHAAILRPKFEAVLAALRGIAPLNIASWTEPKGGYFVSCDAMPGTAKRTLALCAEAGVTMTPAGATYPGGNDPADSNIRIAPSFPPVEELEQAMQIFCLALRMAALERLGL